jgi:hypothetical protein
MKTHLYINVLANDSFITTSPISIDASNGDNGTVESAESSPPQITYSPNSDYFGNDSLATQLLREIKHHLQRLK